MKILFLSFLMSISVLTIAQEGAENSPGLQKDWAAGVSLGSLGIGAEVSYAINSKFGARTGINYLKYEFSNIPYKDHPEVEASNTFKTGAISLTGDYFFHKNWRVSTGILISLIHGQRDYYAIEPIPIQDITATEEEFGTMKVEVTPNKVAPFISMGFGKGISHSKTVSFNVDLGVAYTGQMKASFTADGMLLPSASEKQERQLEDNLKQLQFYPMISFRLNFKLTQ